MISILMLVTLLIMTLIRS
ncbi:hypothetical protein Golax_008952 [Gossypium laxum]|uniref:Uncharacterized protein n=1 Tax=Gossypium laxum TaxID=34288 RepID=A0A7J9ABG4_9ROSI|nr:hypothetical protein [Gossypium laxum]